MRSVFLRGGACLAGAVPGGDGGGGIAQTEGWPREQQLRHARLVAACDLETVVSREYTAGCMLRRDRYMVDHASLLIAAFDGSPGGTRYTMEYAMRQGLEITDLPV